MNPKEFFEQMAQFRTTGVLTMSPGPFRIKVGKEDIYAANVLTEIGPDYEEQKLKVIETHLLNGVVRRLHDLADDDGEITLSPELWEDGFLQGLLTTWWWVVFFAAQHGIDDVEAGEEGEPDAFEGQMGMLKGWAGALDTDEASNG